MPFEKAEKLDDIISFIAQKYNRATSEKSNPSQSDKSANQCGKMKISVDYGTYGV